VPSQTLTIHKLSAEKARSRLRHAPAIAAAGGYLEEEEEKGRRRGLFEFRIWV